MRNHCWLLSTFLVLTACSDAGQDIAEARKAAAERYYRGVYDCESSVVDELAADSIVVSYPVFETLFGTPAIRGREAVRKFADRFCSRWIDAQITVDRIIHNGDGVVIIWRFRAKNGIPGEDGSPPTHEETAWGGITLIGFNERGKIVLEVGEESAPGPYGRLE